MQTQKVILPKDFPSSLNYNQNTEMSDETNDVSDILAWEAQEFWDQLVAELSHTCLCFFHYAPRIIETTFYLPYF